MTTCRSIYRGDGATGFPAIIGIIVLVAACVWAVCGPCAAASKRQHRQGNESSNRAVISGLHGNVTYGNAEGEPAHYHVSGTDVAVHLTVDGSYPNTYHTISVWFGTDELASGVEHVRIDPVGDAGQAKIRTDGSGNWSGRVVFDSTGIMASVALRDLRVRLAPSGYAAFYSNAIRNVQLYNWAYALWNVDLPNAGLRTRNAYSACNSMNYHTSPELIYGNTRTRDVILGELPTYTLFYIASHGVYNEYPYYGVFTLTDCTYDNDSDNNEGHPTPLDEHGMPTSHASYGLAQAIGRKTSIQPYYNFVFLDTCYSAAEGGRDAAVAFRIFRTDGSVWPNHAYIGCIDATWSEDYDWSDMVMDSLVAGTTAGEAFRRANTSYPRDDGYETPDYKVLGDLNTTLHRVYGGVVNPAQ